MTQFLRRFPDFDAPDDLFVQRTPAGVIARNEFFGEPPSGGGGPGPLTFGSALASGGVFGSTYTFTGMTIGPAASDRWVIASFHVSRSFWDGGSSTAVTIGGVSATLLYEKTPDLGDESGYRAFWKALVPSGTTANVVLSTPGGVFYDASAATYYCTGEPTFSAGASDATYTSTTFSVSIDVPDGGSVLAVVSRDASESATWAGVLNDASNVDRISFGSEDQLSAQTGRTVSATFPTSGGNADYIGMAVLSVTVPSTGDAALTPSFFAAVNSFGAAVLTAGAVTLGATIFADGDTFGAAVVTQGGGTQALTATTFADSDTFGAHTVAPGAVSLTATTFADGETFGAASLTVGTVTLTGAAYVDPDSFGSATVSQGGAPQTLTGAIFADADSFGASVVSVGPITLTAANYSDPDTFGAAAITTGPVTLSATSYIDLDTFGDATVALGGGGSQTLTATILGDGDTFGTASVQPGAVTLAATRFAEADAFGAAVVSVGPITLQGAFYVNGGSFGGATVQPGPVTLTAARFVDPDSFGAASISGIIATQIDPTRIASIPAAARTTAPEAQARVATTTATRRTVEIAAAPRVIATTPLNRIVIAQKDTGT